MTSWAIRGLFFITRWPHAVMELFFVCVVIVLLVVSPASAAMRLQDRSLYMESASPGATTSYKISFRYMSPTPIGSIELLFCDDPIPYTPCVLPQGMSVANAHLSDQTGSTGFSITAHDSHRLLLSRSASLPMGEKSIYTLGNVINPTSTDQAFSIRIKTFTSTDGTGDQVDFGSIRGQATDDITVESQVPPMLIFCFAQQVENNCTGTNKTYYTDMGDLSANNTLTAQTQMAVGTNASAGFVITANGTTMSAGTNTIPSLTHPSPSVPGSNQFGINLVANATPLVGRDPEGDWANAVAAPEYSQPNKYKFQSGDVVASSPNVSLMKKFTISYIVNAANDLKAGIYTTTINFIASGRF